MLYFTLYCYILLHIIISLLLSTCDTFYLHPTILKKVVSLQMNLKKEGIIPSRSHRIAKVGKLPPPSSNLNLKIIESTHELTYVKDISHIDTGPISGKELVKAWILDNGLIKAKVILMGGNMVSIVDQDGYEYIWLNKEGATHYGANSNAFPLERGLILHGGIRLAAVTAEHGLYYDTDWDIEFPLAENNDKQVSAILSIEDTQENRDLIGSPFSSDQFSVIGSSIPMSKYPVTDAIFRFQIILKKDEPYVYLDCSVDNQRPTNIAAEAWLPQTYPITKDSQIISHQKKRRIKDFWVYSSMIKDFFLASDMKLDSIDSNRVDYRDKDGFIIGSPPTSASWTKIDLDYPLQWPTSGGGILYDYPTRDGHYHAVSFGDGRGAACVSVPATSDSRVYTKMWSWGDPEKFNRTAALEMSPPLAAGRPKAEYYEPWSSAFNTAFFETHSFPQGKSSWLSVILPIEKGLSGFKTKSELRDVVDTAAAKVITELKKQVQAISQANNQE